MASFFPGRVASTELCVARYGNAMPWEWLQSTRLKFDLDVTTNYHETLCSVLLQSIHGINTTLVLWGDQYWLSSVANGEVYHLIDRCVSYLRSPERDATLLSTPLKIYKMVFLSQIFDAATGILHDAVRRELVSADTASIRDVLPAMDSRTIIVVKLAMLVNEYEAVISIVVPAPVDNCTWDVHAYLRGSDEAVLETNALKAVVLHSGSSQPPSEETVATLQRLQQRTSAPVPNTEAARHLLGLLREHARRPPLAPGQTDWAKARSDELLADLQATEQELVSVRAAFVAANERATSLERALTMYGAQSNPAVRPLLMDPAAVMRENLRVSEELLRRINVDFADLDRRLKVIEKSVNSPSDAKLRMLLTWRQQEAETLLLRMAEAPMMVVSGGHAVTAAANLAAMHEQHSREDGSHSKPLEPNAPSVGTRIAIDPLTLLYQGRLIELENEVSKMVDVDVKACIDEYFLRELERMEKELVQWITRCRSAEEEKAVYEQALKSR